MKEFEYEKRIMGSEASISIIAPARSIADAIALRLFDLAEEVEERFSRFRPESELSRLNEKRTLRVSPEFMEVFLLGRDLYQRSEGVFNPLVDISRFGYDADIREVKGTDRTGSEDGTPYNVDLETVEVDERAMTITLQEGQRLDFGGFLKGHTAEKMAQAAATCEGSIVNLGGDIFTCGRDAYGEPFVFGIDHPRTPTADFSFSLRDHAVATSGSYNRHWKHRGTPFFHILDRLGQGNPDSGLISTTVIAPTGRDADAFATVALVLGEVNGAKMLASHGFEYFFIRSDGSTAQSGGFPLLHAHATLSYAQ